MLNRSKKEYERWEKEMEIFEQAQQSREEKSREEKSREGKSREEKSREEKSRKAKKAKSKADSEAPLEPMALFDEEQIFAVLSAAKDPKVRSTVQSWDVLDQESQAHRILVDRIEKARSNRFM